MGEAEDKLRRFVDIASKLTHLTSVLIWWMEQELEQESPPVERARNKSEKHR